MLCIFNQKQYISVMAVLEIVYDGIKIHLTPFKFFRACCCRVVKFQKISFYHHPRDVEKNHLLLQ